MAMTDEQKAKLAQARAEARAKKQAAELENKSLMKELSSSPGTAVPFQEYRGYMIVEDSGSRVVVAERGLYVTEFDTIEKAKRFLDNVR
jgi:hypothetical protein